VVGGGSGSTAFSRRLSSRAGVVSGDPPGHGLALIDIPLYYRSTSPQITLIGLNTVSSPESYTVVGWHNLYPMN
jgi:hypothetical protein